MKQEERIRFEELDFIYPQHFIEISNFKIPVYAHIKNIHFNYADEIKIGDNYDDYEFEFLKRIKVAKINFHHINITDKLFDGFTKNFLEYYELNNLHELLEYLDESDIMEFNLHFKKINTFLMNTFRNRLYNMLKLDEKEPEIPYKDKHKKPKDLEDFLRYTEGYIIAQSIIEYSPQPFFDENIGKGVNEYSWRELEFRLAYLTMKNKCESLEHKWQMKIMDDNKEGKT